MTANIRALVENVLSSDPLPLGDLGLGVDMTTITCGGIYANTITTPPPNLFTSLTGPTSDG